MRTLNDIFTSCTAIVIYFLIALLAIVLGFIYYTNLALFIAIGIVIAFFPLLQRNLELNLLKFKTRNPFISFTITELIKSSLYLWQFYLLTNIFSLKLLLVLSALLVLGILIHVLFGSVSGFSLPEKDEKIKALTLIYGLEIGISSKSTKIFDTLYIVGIIVNLLVCSGNYLNNQGISGRILQIGICIFIVQEFLQVLLKFSFRNGLIISENFDDDFRNFYLSLSFSNIFYSIFLFVTPFLIANQSNQASVGSTPLWVFILLPLLMFIFFQVLPFVIGTSKFRNQKQLFSNDRAETIHDLLIMSNLPNESVRLEILKETTERINNKIENLSKSNWILDLFKKIENRELKWTVYQDAKFKGTLREVVGDYDRYVSEREDEREGNFVKPSFDQKKAGQILEHKKALIKYDIRISQLDFYKQLLSSLKSDLADLKDYFKGNLERIKFNQDSANRPNYFLPILSTIFGTVLFFLINIYKKELFEIIQITLPK